MPICGTPPFEEFVHYAIYSSYPQLRELLQFALIHQTSTPWSMPRVRSLWQNLTMSMLDWTRLAFGREPRQCAKSAANVYARNLRHEVVGDKCAEHLEEFFGDEAESVRQEVSRAFFGLSGEWLLSLKGFISRFIESKCFENETNRVLHALEQSNVELPEIICRAAERILRISRQGGDAYRLPRIDDCPQHLYARRASV